MYNCSLDLRTLEDVIYILYELNTEVKLPVKYPSDVLGLKWLEDLISIPACWIMSHLERLEKASLSEFPTGIRINHFCWTLLNIFIFKYIKMLKNSGAPLLQNIKRLVIGIVFYNNNILLPPTFLKFIATLLLILSICLHNIPVKLG